MTRSRKNVGNLGEDIAAKFLQEKAYDIVQRNYRWARGEIDIIARKDNILVFVEVKTARGNSFGPPENWVDQRKQEQIGMVAEKYLQDNGINGMDCRFDVIAVELQGAKHQIRHIENAFWL